MQKGRLAPGRLLSWCAVQEGSLVGFAVHLPPRKPPFRPLGICETVCVGLCCNGPLLLFLFLFLCVRNFCSSGFLFSSLLFFALDFALSLSSRPCHCLLILTSKRKEDVCFMLRDTEYRTSKSKKGKKRSGKKVGLLCCVTAS